MVVINRTRKDRYGSGQTQNSEKNKYLLLVRYAAIAWKFNSEC